MNVYFVTRFSIYDPEFRGFRLTTDHDVKEYERRLFHRDRLYSKCDVFQNITLASILKQTSEHWRWLIYVSDRLPEEYAARLRDLVRHDARIDVVAVTNFGEFFAKTNSYDYGASYATVRLDDDDGLSPLYTEKLQQYSADVGAIVCFTEGALARCVRGTISVGETVSEKNNAQGLAGIGLNIYGCGSHSDINTRYRVIYDSSPGMYLLCCSPYADTQRGFTATGRLLGKLRRILFLAWHRPDTAREELVGFVRKRLRRVES